MLQVVQFLYGQANLIGNPQNKNDSDGERGLSVSPKQEGDRPDQARQDSLVELCFDNCDRPVSWTQPPFPRLISFVICDVI